MPGRTKSDGSARSTPVAKAKAAEPKQQPAAQAKQAASTNTQPHKHQPAKSNSDGDESPPVPNPAVGEAEGLHSSEKFQMFGQNGNPPGNRAKF